MTKKIPNARIGRPKGAKDKIQRTVKENALAVFDGMGGYEAMLKWAKDNQRDFYVSIWAKLLPKSVEGDIRHTHTGLAQELTDDELARIIAAGGAGDGAEAESEKDASIVH